jgi:flagellar motor switch protein FliM
VTPESPHPDANAAHRVREIDFRRPSKFPRELVRYLERAHETFCRSASSRLSAELRTGLELAMAPSDQLPYGTAMAELPDEACIAVLDMHPIDTQVALLFEIPLALRIVDRMLGGAGKPRSGEHLSLTDVELAVARRAVTSLTEPLSTLWSDLAGVELSVASMSTSAVTIQLASASEPTLLLRVAARLDGFEARMTLCLPHRSLEPVLNRLARAQEGAAADEQAAAAVAAAVHGVEVEVRAEVGAVDLPLAEVLALREGDVVPLRRSAAGTVVLHADEVPTFVAIPGRNGTARAVQIRGPVGG